MAIKVTTVTLPAHWASGLVNGDLSSFADDPVEMRAYNAAVNNLRSHGWEVVDVARDDDGDGKDPRFTWHYELYGGTAKGGSVLDYVIHQRARARS